jgi:hypothetical protein
VAVFISVLVQGFSEPVQEHDAMLGGHYGNCIVAYVSQPGQGGTEKKMVAQQLVFEANIVLVLYTRVYLCFYFQRKETGTNVRDPV